MNYRKISFFAALCFFLSAVETAIPKPLPFFRLGLANLPVILSLAYMTKKETSLLIILKVFLQALVSGTFFSYIFLFSAAGTFASGFGMMALYSFCKKNISWIGISLWGGLLNNAAQLVCAYFIMFGNSVRYIAPVLLSISLVTSFILGMVAVKFDADSEWLKVLKSGEAAVCEETETAPRAGAPAEGSSEDAGTAAEGMSVSEGRKAGKAPIIIFLICISGIIAVSFLKNLFVVYGIFAAAVTGVFIKKKKIRIIPSLIIIFSVTVLSLFTPEGKILWQWGSFKFTEGALCSGLLKSGKLCAMVFLSQLAVSGEIDFPGKMGIFLKKVFGTTGLLTKEKLNFKERGFFKAVDQRILEVWMGENL